MNHTEVRKHLAEGLNMERNSPTCIAVRSHLDECSECQEYFASLERTIDCYKSYKVDVPSKAHDLLEKTLKDLQNGRK
jgi:predicted anti-sigma-YlaC factor YlaD